MKKLILIYAAIALLTGCGGGVEWFPEYVDKTAVTKTEAPAGAFVSTSRNTVTREWFTETSTGVFRTYTSARFKADEDLTLRTTLTGPTVTDRELTNGTSVVRVKL